MESVVETDLRWVSARVVGGSAVNERVLLKVRWVRLAQCTRAY